MANSVAKTTENVFSTIKWTKYGKRMHRSVQRGASKNCLPANGIRRNYFSIRCCLAHNKWEMTYRSYCNGCTPSDYMFCSTWNEIMCHNSIPHVLVAHSIITIFIHYKSPGDTKFEIWYYVCFLSSCVLFCACSLTDPPTCLPIVVISHILWHDNFLLLFCFHLSLPAACRPVPFTSAIVYFFSRWQCLLFIFRSLAARRLWLAQSHEAFHKNRNRY